MKSQTIYVLYSNVLHRIFANHNQANCKENFKFYGISIDSFEVTLLTEFLCVLLFLCLDPEF